MKFDYWFLSILSIKGEENGYKRERKWTFLRLNSSQSVPSYQIISQITDNR